ncbi:MULTISPECIES: Pycsar system effector family protein [unclassified Streptomyces]|uniref:Pycsar system effector family protein n=1 Tax=unclassified Streptomyces TaxID=2593676 RepID=UPI000DD51076|nr:MULTISPECIES: Pycsar system effector family protein [unclassified Streptomyces]QZZ28446.1 TerD family protein [Streptomyces sp. ST1015]
MSDGEQVSREEAARTAWQVHSVLTEWTRTVDAKASFALAMESAALAGTVALSGSGHRLDNISGALPETALWMGLALVALAAVLAVLAVLPRHNRAGRVRSDQVDDFIFYGHLRHWNPDELADHLGRHAPLPALTRQLVDMSRIVWIKQRLVRQSLLIAVAGCALISIAGITG